MQREERERSVVISGNFDVSTMTGKGRELAGMMDRRRVDIL